MNKDIINVKGWVNLTTYHFTDNDKTHLEKIKEKTQSNLVTNNGKIFFSKKIIDDPEVNNVNITKIKLGSSDTPALVTDKQLSEQFFEKEIIKAITENNIIEFKTAILNDEGSGLIKELGLFTSNNIMICRIILDTPFLKLIDEILTIEWFLQVGDSI